MRAGRRKAQPPRYSGHLSNAQRLELLGVAIYGRQWKRPLAAALGLARFTVLRYHQLRRDPPDEVINHAMALARLQIAHLEKALGQCRLPPWMP